MNKGLKLFLFTFIISVMVVQSHIFDDLTTEEMQEVLDYMFAQPDLALEDQSKAGLDSSFIRMVETLGPKKADALQFLDQGGTKPHKRATAVIFRGDLPTPVIQEYVIWPVPAPANHKLIENSKWRKPIPFSARSPLNTIELTLMPQRMAREFFKVDHILEEATGYRFNNCTLGKCLEIAPGGPAHVVPGKHTFLGYLIRKLEGKFLHPIGLQFVLNMEALDTEDWVVTKVWWQGNWFDSFDAMRRDVDAGRVPSKKLAEPKDAFTENLRSSLNFRGEPRPGSDQRGPRSFNPDGDRIQENGREVSWLGWSFNFNVRSSTGIQLHDVRFLKERIIYELSLQELSVFYSGADPMSQHTAFYDSDAMLGYSGTELFRGVDCPNEARFFDTVHYHKGKPLTFRNTICIFEWNRGIPLRRHYSSNYDGGYLYYQGMPDNILVVRTIPTIDNYDYIVDVMFHQDGKVEAKVTLTGYLVTSYHQGTAANAYGYMVMDNIIGNLHLHAANFKIDMDIAGTSNRVSTLDISTEEINDHINKGYTLINRKFTANLKHTEKDAVYHYNFDTPKYIVFSNANSTNKYGNSRGYRLVIADPVKMLWPHTYRGNKAWAWTKYQMAVTRYDEEEQRSSSLYNFQEPFDPIFSLDDHIEDNQNIVDKDLVTWVTLGTHHIPHTEDVPIVTTPGVQLTFYLVPYNYFNEDPSLASRDNVRVEPGENGDYIFKHSGVPADDYCDRKDVQCVGVTKATAGSAGTSSGSFQVAILVVGLAVLFSL